MAGMKAPDGKRCIAKSHTTGERCRQWAMNGMKVCRFHGAGSKRRPGGRGTPQKPGGHPVTTGLYSSRLSTTLLDRIKEYDNDPTILTARRHLCLIVALSDVARKKLEDLEKKAAELEQAGKLKGKKAQEIYEKDNELLSNVVTVAEKASIAQDRLHKQTHGEQDALDMPMVIALVKAADALILRYVDPSKVQEAVAFFSDALAALPAPTAS